MVTDEKHPCAHCGLDDEPTEWVWDRKHPDPDRVSCWVRVCRYCRELGQFRGRFVRA